MTATELLAHLQRMEVRVWVEGDRLRLSTPKGAVSPELRQELVEHKAELIALLATLPDAQPVDHAGPSAAHRGAGPFEAPVSSAQERMWFFEQLHSNAANHMPLGMRLDGKLNVSALRRALDTLVRRHDSLRSTFRAADGRPVMVIAATGSCAFEVKEVGSMADVDRVLAAEARRPFDLEHGPPMRALLVVVAPEQHTLLLTLHHIIGDGWSLAVVRRELAALYDAEVNHTGASLRPLVMQYADYAAWQQQWLRGDVFAGQLKYWRTRLGGTLPVLELPADRARPSVESHGGERITIKVSSVAVTALQPLARREQATTFMVLLAAFSALLSRYIGQEDLIIGTPVAGRNRPEWEALIGLFVNTLVLRTDTSGDPTFLELLRRVRETAIDAYANQDVPFERLVEELHPVRDPSRNPVFQVMFDLQNMAPLPSLHGLALTPLIIERGAAQLDLTLSVVIFEGELYTQWEFSTDLFDRVTIERLAAHFEQLLTAVIADPAQHISKITLLTAADAAQLLDGWNDTALDHDRTRCLHAMFEESARSSPDKIAVRAGGEDLTYRELDARANRLAHMLVGRGVVPGNRVAVCLDRTVDLPIALLAVLKAGAAYVPLDPAHPAERLQYTIDDANVACIVTLARLASRFDRAQASLVTIDACADELAAQPDARLATTANSADVAYVIYTSGSTGRPKGVEVEHRNVVAFLESMRREPGFSSRDVLLAVTTISFDIAGLELWLPLTTGGSVVLASRTDVLEAERLISLMERNAVTVVQATPSTWRLMLEAGWTGKRDLRALCGGEALPRDLAAALIDRVGELWNMYGPTETTIWSTLCRVEDADAPITIGHPIRNTRIYILEPSGNPAPIGVPGELCIAGEGVARGYHNRPELTAERFSEITLPNGRVERVYRTGDLARFRADGRIDFLGRRDQQVKVRGHRIELGEIEAALAAQPGVKTCVATVREDSPGDQRIVAYVIEAGGAQFDADAVRTALRERLPEYMIPHFFSVLTALPLTGNGKVDRKSLPAPVAAARPSSIDAGEVSMTPAQRRVAAAWRDVLRVDRVGLHDNFFDVGGHSLLLVKLRDLLKREFGGPLELVELFQWTTVAAQSTRLSSASVSDGALRRAKSRAARQIQ